MKEQMTPLEEIRHSSSHVLATAVLRLFPDAKLDIGPPTDTGFYYDFDLDHKFTADDLEKIEAEMKKVIKENQRFERIEVSREEAVKMIKEIGQETYKLGRLDDIPEGDQVSFYRNGEFLDLCAGSHVNYTKKIKAFKLLSIAGAYHRGDEKNKQLQRIYGTAFASKDELETYLNQLEESRKRDHRRVGKDMGLFHIDDAVGQGLILWKPKGAIVRQELQDFISEQLIKQEYSQVFTPHIGKLGLYKTSGHFPYYQESQFPPLIERDSLADLAEEGATCSTLTNNLETGDIEGYLLKPMNCPMHIKIFASEPHSYRDLPIRLAEFGTVYRWEQSGELNGMTRVRGFTQDDAHLFCTEEQLQDEIQGCLDLVKIVFGTLGMEDYSVRVSLRDPNSDKYVGDPANWDKAEAAIREAVKTLGVPFVEEEGEAAFYGPKIDFVVKDVIGREWQLGTVQVDYNLPVRFDISYTGSDNKPHRPVMVHRAPFGSMERFCGLLIEHFGGDFPTWLAPEQVRVLPISDKVRDYAESLVSQLKANGVRATGDFNSDKLGAKIRNAELDKVPNTLIVGEREAEEGKVSVRSRFHDGKPTMLFEEFETQVLQLINERTLQIKK
ncbi:threonine--tRNA ligase [Pelagicoccus sp. NFK12]|uniref:Threonine--tRNA ligase n=1 Tax=Pelagicoccus enzymogenes TaxID=2773457 RepID=A0A927F910_9BACT|nr:threonine--tRNA ligase [Pelagicoccus enzymogenes]MBD5779390.1 threonine--tRNA ligase [Pelagicoccus enzymogenes]MDQ8200571.1 threonine--tRNA ligase [Pelagicoccus enzymogenes]